MAKAKNQKEPELEYDEMVRGRGLLRGAITLLAADGDSNAIFELMAGAERAFSHMLSDD